MSITFWIPQAPLERVQPYPDEPDYWEQRPVEPFCEVNMTAGNANAILQLISPEDVDCSQDPCGTWDHAKLQRVRVECMAVINRTKSRESALLAPVVSQEPGRCKFYAGGRDDEYILTRLVGFLNLTKVAMEHGFSVSFG